MQAWHHGIASPPTLEYIRSGALDCSSQSSDSDSDCASSATLTSSASSLSTLASAASTSMWSAPSSQRSDITSLTVCESDSGESQKRYVPGKLFGETLNPGFAFQQTPHESSQAQEVPPELRKNPRRTSAASSASHGCPPTLFRQVDRKVEFVDKLVDSATYIVEAIWPTSSVPSCNDFGTSTSVLPLRKFIEETLRRSRTSFSTLQVGLYYLILIKPHIPAHDFTMEQTDESHASRVLQCGRRMFLAALILASKWLQDRNYSARAWSKISGLKISEINENELAFLSAVNWKLHIGEDLYNVWSDCVMKHTPSLPPTAGGSGARAFERECVAFKKLIQGLSPELDNLDDILPVTVMDRRRSLARLSQSQKCGSYYPVLEPQPSAVCTPGRQAPALGLLPTPRRMLSQSSSGFSTSAVSAASQLLGRTYSIASADRWSAPVPSFTRTASPPSYAPTRRSSLATTVSTASSPESMVSDSSGNSLSSTISSASLSHNAPAYMQARRAVGERQRMIWNGQQYQLGQTSLDEQSAKKWKLAMGDVIDLTEPSLPSDSVVRISASPESYNTHPTDYSQHQMCSKQDVGPLSVRDAAYALQELHNHRDSDEQTPRAVPSWSTAAAQGPKRKRMDDTVLQESVRDLLAAQSQEPSGAWSEDRTGAQSSYSAPWLARGDSEATVLGSCKRARLSASDMYQPHLNETYGQHRSIPSMVSIC